MQQKSKSKPHPRELAESEFRLALFILTGLTKDIHMPEKRKLIPQALADLNNASKRLFQGKPIDSETLICIADTRLKRRELLM